MFLEPALKIEENTTNVTVKKVCLRAVFVTEEAIGLMSLQSITSLKYDKCCDFLT